MFRSRDAWRSAGFDVSASVSRIMVASHPAAPGVLFKKYTDDRDEAREERDNFRTRIDGADRLRDYVAKKSLQHIVVPRKWIRELPDAFRRRHLLVVERISLCDSDEIARRYHDVDPGVLRDLCRVVRKFRGVDSTARNMPFTTDGRIAFVDTERWRRNMDGKEYLYQVSDLLSRDRRRLAGQIFEELA